MHITLSDGLKYRLFFRHHYESKVFVVLPATSDDVSKASIKAVKQPVVTECLIKRDEGNGALIDVGCGVAMKNPIDNPNKEIARQVSLSRAIEDFTKEDREIIMYEYNNRSRFV